jgi:hypothetical protein
VIAVEAAGPPKGPKAAFQPHGGYGGLEARQLEGVGRLLARTVERRLEWYWKAIFGVGRVLEGEGLSICNNP